MDAVRFVKEILRMCSTYEACLRVENDCLAHKEDCAKLTVDKVEQWSKDNPKKTYLMDFKEKYPDAPVKKNGFPELCPDCLSKKAMALCDDLSSMPCEDCWNQPMDD